MSDIGPTFGQAYDHAQIPLSLRFEHRPFWIALTRVLKCAEATAAVALAAYFAAKVSNRWISYSARSEHYAVRKIVCEGVDRDSELIPREPSKIYTWRLVMGAIDHLASLKMIEDWRQQPGHEGWRSCFRPKQALLDLVARVIGEVGMPAPARPDPDKIVKLRDKDGLEMTFRETAEIRRWRKIAMELNEFLREADISTGSACLVRIFNQSFDRGGRFYCAGGAWQLLGKNERRRILIDGESVAELDYTTIHPRMAYAMFGLPVPSDAYDVGGDWDRKLVKAAMMTALNAKNFHDAMLSVSANKRIGAIKRSREARVRATNLLNRIRIVHWQIEALFFSDAGATFMLRDAGMAELILTTLMKKGVTCLPIHDSFVVRQSQRQVLLDAMREAAERGGMGNIGIEEPDYDDDSNVDSEG